MADDLPYSGAGTDQPAPLAAQPSMPASPLDELVSPDKQKQLETRLQSLQTQKIGAEGALEAQQERRDAQYRRNMQDMISQEGAVISNIKPWNAEEQLAQHKTDLWEQFGSPGFLVAMIGSAFTRMPMNSALNAGAAAMNAINQGDMKAYDKAFDAWKENTDLVIKRLGMMHQEFADIDKLRATDLQEWERKMKLSAARFDDKATLTYMEAGMFPELYQRMSAMATARSQMESARTAIEQNELRRRLVMSMLDPSDMHNPQKMVEAAQKAETLLSATETAKTPEQALWNEFIAKHPNATLDEKTQELGKIMQAAKPSMFGRSPQDISNLVKGVMSGDLPPTLSRLYGSAAAVQSGLEAAGFNLSKAQLEWDRAQKQITALNGAQMTRFVGLAQTVDNTINEVRRLSSEMQFSGIPALNHVQLQSYIQAQGNSKNGQLAASYLSAVNTLKEEFANLAQGGYAPREAAWKLADQQINGDYGVRELDASLTEVQRLIKYRLNGIPGIQGLGAGAPNRYSPPSEEMPVTAPGGGSDGWGSVTVH